MAVADDGDFIVCLAGHSQTVTGWPILIAMELTIIGCGVVNGSPSVRFMAADGIPILVLLGPNIAIHNIGFDASAVPNPFALVMMLDTDCQLVGCEILPGPNDFAGLLVTATADFVTDTTVRSVGTDINQPNQGIYVDAPGEWNIALTRVTLDNGPWGFANYGAYALAESTFAGMAGVRYQFSLLRGAVAQTREDNSGWVTELAATNGGRVQWIPGAGSGGQP
jgi:hypothetical protein